TFDQRPRNIAGLHAARCGARAKVAERMSRLAMPHEVDAGRSGGVDTDAFGIDPFFVPKREKHASELVIAELGDVGAPCTLAQRGNHHIRRVAAESLQISTPISVARLIELDHRLADGDDIDG